MADRKNKLNMDNITELTTESKAETKKATKAEPKEQKKKPIKDQSAYLKLDLRPSDCPELQEYILEQSAKLVKGKRISTTRYIQNVLIEHMENKKGRQDKYADLLEMIEQLDKEELKAVKTLLKSITDNKPKAVKFTLTNNK